MPPVKRRMYPTKQIAVAEMFVKLEQTRALFLRMLDDARVDPPKDARLRAYASSLVDHHMITDLVPPLAAAWVAGTAPLATSWEPPSRCASPPRATWPRACPSPE